jgi:hypothetical protein
MTDTDYHSPIPRKKQLQESWEKWAKQESWVDSCGLIAERAYMAGFMAGIAYTWKQRMAQLYHEGYRDGVEAGRTEAEQYMRDANFEAALEEGRHAAFE